MLIYETALSIYKAVCSDSAKLSVNVEGPDYLHCFSVSSVTLLSKLTKLYF